MDSVDAGGKCIFLRSVESEGENYRLFCKSILKHDVNTLRTLVEKMDDVDFPSNCANGLTPLCLAVREGSYEMTKMLLMKKANPNVQYWSDSWEDSITPLVKAICIGNAELVELLLNFGAKIENTKNARCKSPLHLACFGGSDKAINIIKLLLKFNAKVDCLDEEGYTPLLNAKSPAIIELLLQNGANVNYQSGKFGFTILHKAVNRQYGEDFIELLLKRGADVELRNHLNQSALQMAVMSQNVKALKLMLQHRPDVDINKHFYRFGYTLLHLIVAHPLSVTDSCKCYELLYTLLTYGADIHLSDNGRGIINLNTWKSHKACTFFAKMSALKNKLDIAYLFIDSVEHREISEYQSELHQLHNILICARPKVSLYDLLFYKISKMVKFSTNQKLVTMFNDCGEDFGSKYPHYGLILNYKIKMGMKRSHLIEAAKDALTMALSCRVPESCSDKIFSCVGETQLKELQDYDWNSSKL